MSCGFGAVILIFIVINHSTETTSQEINAQLLAEVRKLEIEVKDETLNLIEIKNSLEETNELAFQQTIDALCLLLFAQLVAIGRDLPWRPRVHSGGIVPPVDCTLFRKAALPFQEELHAFATAQLTDASTKSSHIRVCLCLSGTG